MQLPWVPQAGAGSLAGVSGKDEEDFTEMTLELGGEGCVGICWALHFGEGEEDGGTREDWDIGFTSSILRRKGTSRFVH